MSSTIARDNSCASQRAADSGVFADRYAGSITREMAIVACSLIVLIASARLTIPLPFTPVPFAMAPLAVLFIGGLTGPIRGGITTGLYILAGIAGAPIFSDGQHGWALPTLGYILGYVLAAIIIGACVAYGWGKTLPRMLVTSFTGMVFIYLVGFIWLSLSTGRGFGYGYEKGVLPFLVSDALKILITAGVVPALNKFVQYHKK